MTSPCEKHTSFRGELCPICLMDERDALRAELKEWKSAHDNLARQLSVANDTVEIAYEGLRELMDRIEKGGNQDEPQQA